MVATASPPLILVLGATGAGKSTFIRSVVDTTTGKQPEINGSLFSSAAPVEAYEVSRNATTVLLVDTPGFNDTYLLNRTVLKDILEFLRQRKKGYKVTGMIYLLDITNLGSNGVNLGNLHPPPSCELVTVACHDDNAAHLDRKKKALKEQYPSLIQEDHFGSNDQDQLETAWKVIHRILDSGKHTPVQTAIQSLETLLQDSPKRPKARKPGFFSKLFQFVGLG